MGFEVYGLHFDYGQRTMRKERECFELICSDLGAKSLVLDAGFIQKIGGNALTDYSVQIPKDRDLDLKNGFEKLDQIPKTYVPFRNGIFLSIAYAYAEKIGADAIFIGVVEEDSSGYPDCSDEFIKAFTKSASLGTATKQKAKIYTPLVHLNKSQIVQKAFELGVRLDFTWSCYESEDEACGECESCKLRLRGFKNAKKRDLIKYKSFIKNEF